MYTIVQCTHSVNTNLSIESNIYVWKKSWKYAQTGETNTTQNISHKIASGTIQQKHQTNGAVANARDTHTHSDAPKQQQQQNNANKRKMNGTMGKVSGKTKKKTIEKSSEELKMQNDNKEVSCLHTMLRRYITCYTFIWASLL